MINEDPIGIIELGNINLKCLICKIDNENKLQILSSSSTQSDGIHNGVVLNLAKASNAIRLCVSEAEKKAVISIKKIHIVLEQPEFLCTKLSKDRKINGSKISKEDIEFLLKEGKKQVTLNDHKQSIIHIFNHNYIVDGKIFIEEPINVFADYLKHEMTFITMPKNNIKNITEAFNNCDIDVDRFISCIFVLAIKLIKEDELHSGSMIIDIGYEKISIGMFKNLALVHSITLPVGVNHFIKDLAKVSSLNIEESKKIISEIDFSFENKKTNIFDSKNHLKEMYFTKSNYRKISKDLIFDIVKARMDEICQLIAKQMIFTGFNKKIGVTINLVGGGSNLENIDEYFSKFFKVNVKKIKNDKTNSKNLEENFIPCLGAIKLIEDGWETEAIPEGVGKDTQKIGFFAKIFGNKQ